MLTFSLSLANKESTVEFKSEQDIFSRFNSSALVQSVYVTKNGLQVENDVTVTPPSGSEKVRPRIEAQRLEQRCVANKYGTHVS